MNSVFRQGSETKTQKRTYSIGKLCLPTLKCELEKTEKCVGFARVFSTDIQPAQKEKCGKKSHSKVFFIFIKFCKKFIIFRA